MKRSSTSKPVADGKNTLSADGSSSSSTTNASEKSKSYPPETLLSLAVEAAIIGLGQQRIMPPGIYT